MALIDDVQTVCHHLAPHGWADLLGQHGLDITASNLAEELARELQGIRRDLPGFEDFAMEGERGIEPGRPVRSLLFHALASPNVLRGAANEPLGAFPTLAEIDVVENYVFGAKPPTLQELKERVDGAPLAVAVFASEYRTAMHTSHRKHADLVFARTGVARVGTAEPLYDSERRGFVPFVDGEPFAIRVSPSRFAAYVAVQKSGDGATFRPMNFRAGDDGRLFWLPLHKLFSGTECLRDLSGGEDLQVTLSTRHVNEKIRRIHIELRKHRGPDGQPHDPGFDEPDISNPPFRFTEGIAEMGQEAAFGPGVLVPAVHPRLVEPAQYQGEPLTFNVPRGGPTLSSSLNIPRRREDNNALPGPEFVHARREVPPDGSPPIDLNRQADVAARVRSGGYAAQHFVDFTGDGAVEVSVPQITRPDSGVGGPFAAYSLVTAPDFFTTCGQREVTEWTIGLPDALEGDIWRVRPTPLSDHRFAANLQLPPQTPFQRGETTITAIVPLFGEGQAQNTQNQPADALRHSHLPDDAAGVFAPGWDVSRDRHPDGTPHLAAYGLGSPFPEDAKLCAALSAFWPAAAPDATRTMEPLRPDEFTVAPLTDEEIGRRSGSIPWDGVPGPKVGTDATGATVADFASFSHVDYVENALAGEFSPALTSHIGVEEYQNRVLAMNFAYQALGLEKESWLVLGFRRVTPGDPELLQAQQRAQLTLPDDVYRFGVFLNGASTVIPGDFDGIRFGVRFDVRGRVILFVDPRNHRVLLRREDGPFRRGAVTVF
jgi:hypothetical protein